MDTDFPLPIPMHRPYLIEDTRYDKPLPFRHHLKQVTKLTAENSTPYSLPKISRLPLFERLPYDVREHIYDILGTELDNEEEYDRPCTRYDERLWYRQFPSLDGSILSLNHNIRTEVLNIMSRRHANSPIHLDFHLSDRKIFFNNMHASNPICKLVPGNWERMQFASSSFAFLRRVRLSGRYLRVYENERPHPRQVSRKQRKRPIVKQAGSIRFLAKHCPMLVSLHIDPHDFHSCGKRVPAKLYEPVVFALKEMARSCQNLEVVGIFTYVNLRYLDEDGTLDKLPDSFLEEDAELNLSMVPGYSRDDVTESWSRTTFREYMDHGPEVRILSFEDWENKHGPHEPWC